MSGLHLSVTVKVTYANGEELENTVSAEDHRYGSHRVQLLRLADRATDMTLGKVEPRTGKGLDVPPRAKKESE